MKPKYILILSVVLLLVIIAFMAKDLFYSGSPNPENIYEYDLKKLKETDPSLLCYEEVLQIVPMTDYLFAIAMDDKDNLYVSGSETLFMYDVNGNLLNSFALGNNAYCLTISESGNIYMGMPGHVEVWNAKGEQLESWDSMGYKAILESVCRYLFNKAKMDCMDAVGISICIFWSIICTAPALVVSHYAYVSMGDGICFINS